MQLTSESRFQENWQIELNYENNRHQNSFSIHTKYINTHMDTHIQRTHTSHIYTHSYKQRTVTLKKQAIKENPLFLEQNTLLYYKTDFFFRKSSKPLFTKHISHILKTPNQGCPNAICREKTTTKL